MDGGSEIKISATEFKAKCLGLLDRLKAKKIKRIIVTKRGKAVAVLTPPADQKSAADDLFGCLRGRMMAPKNFDFTTPALDEPLNAMKGRIHE